MGCDLGSKLRIVRVVNFNPRTHVGCDRAEVRDAMSGKNFNPRTHVGCDKVDDIMVADGAISIHAPTWGATHGEAGGQHRPAISIHAPTWGATLFNKGTLKSKGDFNPRTHVGCDRVPHRPYIYTQNFNPRTHVGCDPASLLTSPPLLNFNPRTHVGCDDKG